jgi:hypothetical protein
MWVPAQCALFGSKLYTTTYPQIAIHFIERESRSKSGMPLSIGLWMRKSQIPEEARSQDEGE